MTTLQCLALRLVSAATVSGIGWAAGAESVQEQITLGNGEVFVFRTSKLETLAGTTPFCASAPFASIREEHYALASLKLNTSSSRMTTPHVREVGSLWACFSGFSSAAAGGARTLSMYAKGGTARISWTGSGDCTVMAAQPPGKTVLALSCQLSLSDLPHRYVGGFLVSNTMTPALDPNGAPNAHARGHLSTSVVTVRLWKKIGEK